MMIQKPCYRGCLYLALLMAGLCLLLPFYSPVQAQGNNAAIQITGPLQPPGFFPVLLTVHVNDYITFVNQSSPPVTVTLAAEGGVFSSPPIAPGKTWAVTLSSPGEYAYHDTASPPRMVGEIIVVPDTVSLLPPPDPAVAATAQALIEAGKTPPDTLANPTPTPAASVVKPFSSGNVLVRSAWLVVVAGLLVVLLACVVLFIRRKRRKRQQPKDHDDAFMPAVTEPRKKRFALLRRRGSKDEDEDELEEVDDEL